MSIRDAWIICDRCNLRGPLYGPSKICYTRFEGRRVLMRWALGYCPDCSLVGRLRERLRTDDEFDTERDEIISRMPKGTQHFFDLFRSKEKSYRNYLNERLEAIELSRRAARANQDGERCYHCHRTNVVALPSDQQFSTHAQPLGDIHPGCGGRWMIQEMEYRPIYIKPEEEMFDYG